MDETASSETGGARISVKGREVPWTNLPDLLADKAARHGDMFFCEVDGTRLGRVELDRRSAAVGSAFAALGVGPGDRVASVLYNCPEQLYGWFGALRIGALWTTLNAGLTGADLLHGIRDADAKVLVAEPETWERIRPLAAELPAGMAVFCTGTAQRGVRLFAELLEAAPCDRRALHPGDPAMIIYSGGTTGLPKGIVLPHFALVAAGLRYGEVTGAAAGDVHYTTLPLFHVGGTQLGLIGPLLNDCTTHIDRRFSVSGYWRRVRETGATIIDPIGTMMTALTQAPPIDDERDHSVRFCFGVTGQIPKSVPDRFRQRFGLSLVDIYGLTEAGGSMLTSNRPPDGVSGSVGRPHGWSEIMIADELDQPMPTGGEGEILMRPVVPFTFMTEYHGNPDATRRALRNMWLHTGDIGRLDEAGNLHFVGRQAHWLRRRGENISAHEVESLLSQFPGVREVVVVGVPAELGEEDVKAFVIPEGAPFDPVDLVTWCLERMATFKVPRYVEFVDEFPRSVTKREIERPKLKALGNERTWDRERAMGRLSSQARNAPTGGDTQRGT